MRPLRHHSDLFPSPLLSIRLHKNASCSKTDRNKIIYVKLRFFLFVCLLEGSINSPVSGFEAV